MTFPISKVKEGYTLEETRRLRAAVSVPEILKQQEVAAWWGVNIAQVMPTALLNSALPASDMAGETLPGIAEIMAAPELGRMSLARYLAHPEARMQGICVAHKGRIVYEAYPGMRPEQPHFWASCAKPMAALAVELLIDDGLIDDKQAFGHYIPFFCGSHWENVRIIDAMDMTPGLDCEENDDTRADPDSIVIRAFLAEFGAPWRGRQERLADVLRATPPRRKAGEVYEYGSPTTQMLVLLAEAVSGCAWSDFFAARVWSQMRTEGPMQIHLSPDGVALAHGVASSTLRDMARFGMLYTPSWQRVSDTQIVSDATMERIRDGLSRGRDFFFNGHDGRVFSDRFDDRSMLGAARQWDCIWEDGDMYKGGFMGQALYVSPARDLVITFFSTRQDMSSVRFLRPIATAPIFARA